MATEITPKQQAVAQIQRAQRILIAPGRPDGDSIGSALGLWLALSQLKKDATIYVVDPIPPSYHFLPQFSSIVSELTGLRDFIITITNPEAEPDKLSYNFANGQLNIVITPKRGNYEAEQVAFSHGGPKYDLVITLDAADLGQLGQIYEQNPNLFSEIPVINIDHHASNSYFGAVNLVDLTATSTGEILVSLIEALGLEIDSDIATCLLTGIISDTGSFQHSNTTPKSLTVAAQMVGFGARQQDIIKHLFKTKSLASLRLWGKILTRLQHRPDLRVVWSQVSLEEITTLQATPEDISGLIDELMTSIPETDLTVLLSERAPNKIYGSIRTARGVDAAAFARLFGGGGHPGAAAFQLTDTPLAEAERQVLAKAELFQSERLKPAPIPTPSLPAL